MNATYCVVNELVDLCLLRRSIGSIYVLFCKQKTAYELRISDWSSDVCSSDLLQEHRQRDRGFVVEQRAQCIFAGAELDARDIGEPRDFAVGAGLDDDVAELLFGQIGRAHVCTPVTNAHLVCRLLLDKKHKTR